MKETEGCKMLMLQFLEKSTEERLNFQKLKLRKSNTKLHVHSNFFCLFIVHFNTCVVYDQAIMVSHLFASEEECRKCVG